MVSTSFTELSPLFCDFTWLPPKSMFSTLPLENLDEVQRCSELLHRDGLYHHVCWISFITDLHQVDHFVIYNPLTFLVIPPINVLHPLMMHMLLNKMNSILTVTVNLNWIMYDAKYLDQYSQPQDFLRCLNCNKVSASVVERAIVSCNSIFQLMTHSATVNT